MPGYDIKPAKWLSFDFRELWHFRELFAFMAWRDIKVKYKQTLLGFIWVILQPLVLMIIFNTLWQKIINIETPGIPYPVFAYSGLIFWGLFSSGISGSGESMISNSNIIRKVYFPRIIIPSSAVIVALFDFFITLILYFVLIIRYGVDISLPRLFGFLSISIFLTLISSFGIGLIIASATIKYRDFRYIVPFFLQALFFVSPVVYPLTLYNSEPLRYFLSLNPVAGAINLARSALTGYPADWNMILVSSIVTLIILITGLTMFSRVESQYSDML
jgi:lipopolysaccharide transport system permease protein